MKPEDLEPIICLAENIVSGIAHRCGLAPLDPIKKATLMSAFVVDMFVRHLGAQKTGSDLSKINIVWPEKSV